MTEITKNYVTENYNHNNTIYSGEIEIEDFNTSRPNKKRINNQYEANNLQTTLINKKKMEDKYKSMTLEELREQRLISNTNGRPTADMTDEKWQREFNIQRMFINPYPSDVTKLKGRYSRESRKWNEETQGTYHGETNWNSYCRYINDVLDNIRCGHVDYCYYIYQILDLLKFHYNTLKTKYCDGYWEVWLER